MQLEPDLGDSYCMSYYSVRALSMMNLFLELKTVFIDLNLQFYQSLLVLDSGPSGN